MPDLVIEDLRVTFPGLERPALAISSLRIEAGERFAVTGPSGCGKTTLVNIVSGLERAGQGTVRWGGQDLARLSEAARDRWRAGHVGLVMQEFHLFPGLSALENVLLPKRVRKFRLPRETAGEAKALLERVGITRLGQAVETMSRGQMQRVAVARALLGSPSVLVADEPTASLDADTGIAVADLFLELAAERGITTIVATHDRALMARLDRVLVFESGRMISDTIVSKEAEVGPAVSLGGGSACSA